MRHRGLDGTILVTALAGMLIALAPASTNAEDQLTPRVIKLGTATDDVGWRSPRARVSVHPFDPALIKDDVINPFIEISVQGLACRPSGGFYSLYLHTPSFGRQRILSFNTQCTFRTFHGDSFLYGPGDPTVWFTEPLTVEIVEEVDDGLEGTVAVLSAVG